MDHFRYRDRALYCEDVPLAALAQQYGTPLYVYSKATLLHHLGQIQQAFASADPLICYSLKHGDAIIPPRLRVDAIHRFSGVCIPHDQAVVVVHVLHRRAEKFKPVAFHLSSPIRPKRA